MGLVRGSGAGPPGSFCDSLQAASGEPDHAAAHFAHEHRVVGHGGARHRHGSHRGHHARRYASRLYRQQQPALRPSARSARRDGDLNGRRSTELCLHLTRWPMGRVRGGQHAEEGGHHGRAACDDRTDRSGVRGDLGAGRHDHLCHVGSTHRPAAGVGSSRGRRERAHAARAGTRRARSPLARDASRRPVGAHDHHGHDWRACRRTGGRA